VIFFYYLGTLYFLEYPPTIRGGISSIRRIFYLNIKFIGNEIVISTIFGINNGNYIKHENVALSYEIEDEYRIFLVDCERIDDIQDFNEFPSIWNSTFAFQLVLMLENDALTLK